MAWLYKRGKRWWIGWRDGGIQHLQPTGETDRAKAEEQLRKYELMKSAKAAGALSEQMVSALTRRAVARPNLRDYLNDWLTESRDNTKAITMVKYNQVVREFIAFVGGDLLLSDVTQEHAKRFFASKRERSASSTVAAFRRILNSIFTRAHNEGKIAGNPIALAKIRAAKTERQRKRPFTLAEIKDMHGKASPFWQYMLVAGFYSGQSLGDLITLRRRNVSLEQNHIALNRRKTGTRVIVPMAKPLRALIQSRWPKTDEAYFWTAEAKRYETTGASSFSQEFYALMASCGIVPERGAKAEAKGVGRSNKRDSFGLGFHNMRHTFVTKLKEVGAVDSVARELAGHGSNAMSAHYTHLPEKTLSDAINKLPETL